MAYKKTYVEVVASFREDGLLLPREIVWEDGRRYEIDGVSDVRPGSSMKVGGQGDRYTIWLNGQQRYIFFERNASLQGITLDGGLWKKMPDKEITCNLRLHILSSGQQIQTAVYSRPS